MNWNRFFSRSLAVAAILSACSTAGAAPFRITFENLQPAGGFSLTPAWVGFHDGAFDLFDGGAAASPELELLAELGDPGGIMGIFGGDQTVLGQPAGFAGAPIVEPGEMATTILDVDPANGFISFASMVIPSNDTFIANADPMMFAAPGLGDTLTFEVGMFYDAGTEVNDPDDGAAFSTTGGGGAAGAAEGGVVTLADLADFNATFAGTSTPAGVLTADLALPIARFSITAVPEPTTLGLMSFAGLFGLLGRRRRRADA